ncbi:uncharacterized protein LOC132749121 [Ruditapes philippinarum]|uniref:uncharacterized protein LOC132749121 n=1 Tax=Ruditapes philippinarum TaxID=129788 RepID=UPI00295A5F4F|nr:uncharacterized protein LOC132749121 [Ruditapes philippinarum]
MATGGKLTEKIKSFISGADKPDSDPLTDMQISQVLEALKKSGDYVVLTKDEYNVLKGPGPTSTPIVKTSFQNPFDASALQMPKVDVKLPFFSGEVPPLKGDVTYDVWRYETKCLLSDSSLTENICLQVIRKSLRGSARQVLIPLGEKATLSDILNKLDTLFGNVSTNESVMQSFYSESQKPSENVTSYGCRLETLLQVAVERGHVSHSSRNDMLKSKFWTGLYDEKLKLLTSHKYDAISDYNRLLREVRAAEQELSTSDKLTKVQCQPISDSRDKMVEDLSKKMDTLMTKMQSLEKDIKDSKKQDSSNNSNSFSGYNRQSFSGYNRGNFSRFNKQRNSFAGYNRGNFRGRGQQQNRNYGHQQNVNVRSNNSDNSSFNRSDNTKTVDPKV